MLLHQYQYNLQIASNLDYVCIDNPLCNRRIFHSAENHFLPVIVDIEAAFHSLDHHQARVAADCKKGYWALMLTGNVKYVWCETAGPAEHHGLPVQEFVPAVHTLNLN